MNASQRTFFRRAGRLAAFSLVAVMTISGALLAGEINEENGVAIKGYDPVAYFTDHRPVLGRAEFVSTYKGATFRFASAEHKKAFDSNPVKYAPQYGGFCAFATAAGSKADIDPAAFSLVDRKLYLNYSPAVQDKWRKGERAYIKDADRNWPTVAKLTEVNR